MQEVNREWGCQWKCFYEGRTPSYEARWFMFGGMSLGIKGDSSFRRQRTAACFTLLVPPICSLSVYRVFLRFIIFFTTCFSININKKILLFKIFFFKQKLLCLVINFMKIVLLQKFFEICIIFCIIIINT